MNKFLILGTGADINDIDFDRIDDSFITAGVNRIYEKFIPEYYYIYDLKDVLIKDGIAVSLPEGIHTICTHPDKLYEYMSKRKNYKQNFFTYYDPLYTATFTHNGDEYECNQSSINYLIRMLNDRFFSGGDNVFFLAGVPLLESVGHFYSGTGKTTQVVLNRFYNDFIRLKNLGYNIFSIMKESKLNDLFPTEDINMIYKDANYAIA